MSADVVRLPKRDERELEPVLVGLHARDIAKALGGSGVLLGRYPQNWWRCRCPLCGGSLRVANRNSYAWLAVHCAEDCNAERVVAELVRLGHVRCKSGWWRR
jgi:hypothetical protein